ncbi:MAG: tyrosine--tRNA ligase [Chloroflexi bacterium]|nr:tyrosine--tRNA ligase [Chloroflexota bacterium]
MADVDTQLAALLRGTDFGDEATRRAMERELRARLAEDRPLRVYCGYDPTSVDLHLGHTLTMRKLRQFQDFGHEVTFLVGNFTGLVGDPSDKDRRRPMLTAEQLGANAATYAQQAGRILDMSKTHVRYNADWLGELSFADVIRLCSHFTMAEFLRRDNFARRHERGDAIHLSEFLYSVMQGYDAVALETDVQVGGSDQLFNLMAGRKLQEAYGQPPQVVITLPILVGTDGHVRMSKSLGNYIGVDEGPRDVFGKVMSVPDAAMRDYFTLLTSVPADEVDGLLAGPPLDAKKRLGESITASLHGVTAAAEARAYFEATVQRRETPEEMPAHRIAAGAARGLADVLVAAHLANSKAEVRRLVAQKAIRINGGLADHFDEPLADGDELKVGPHRFLRIVDEEAHA